MEENQNSKTPETTCEGCTHYRRYFGLEKGECYRFPPVPFANRTQVVPEVKSDRAACGEHRSRVTAPVVVEKEVVPTPGAVVAAARADKKAKSK